MPAKSRPRNSNKQSHHQQQPLTKSFLKMVKSAINEVQISPLRTLDDFLLESARFQIPNFKDLDRWSNRLLSNLLYYQTNYLLASLVIFMIVGFMHPVEMFCGFLALFVAFGLFYYITNERRPAEKFKRNHPFFSLIVVLAGGYFIVYMFGSVVVFLTGIMLPLIVVFMHASMRLRNIKNKISNKMEQAGLNRSPMGIFLKALDGSLQNVMVSATPDF